MESTPPVPESFTRISKPNQSVQSIFNSWWIWLLIGLVIVALIILLTLLILWLTRKTNKRPAGQNSTGQKNLQALRKLTIPIYLHADNDEFFMSDQSYHEGAVVQNDGLPILSLFAYPAHDRIPVFMYRNPRNEWDTRWGTDDIPPTGYIIGNHGLQIGYLVAHANYKHLLPVYEVLSIRNGKAKNGILSHLTNPTYNGVKFVRVSSVPLGYSS